jgi:hypothetical protein
MNVIGSIEMILFVMIGKKFPDTITMGVPVMNGIPEGLEHLRVDSELEGYPHCASICSVECSGQFPNCESARCRRFIVNGSWNWQIQTG